MNYPDDFINKVICGDCLEVMKGIPDGSVDLVLTDPPYGIGESNEKNLSRGKLANPKNYGHYDWDSERIDRRYFEQIFRISKNQMIFGGNYYTDFLFPSSCWIVWDKDNGNNDFADCELVWTSFKTAVRKFKWRWNGMFQEKMGDKEVRVHPTQKPLPVLRWILNKYSKENDLILDTFAGSFTTCVAAKQLGRRFIGIEINEDYCKIGQQRLAQEILI